MLTIGILCSRKGLAEAVEQAVALVAIRAGMDYMVKNIHMGDSSSQDWEDFSCLVLSLENMEQTFAWAESLWKAAESLPVIYVAQSVEELSASLQQPFFHIVRTCSLEQDLEATLRKLGRLRFPSSEKISFTGSKGTLLVRRNEILYLESQHHDIQLHMEALRSKEALRSMEVKGSREAVYSMEVISVSETLAQCEEKLRSKGFVRIHRSFLVNMYHIRHMDKESVALDNGERLYISRHRYTEVKLRFENYIRHLEFL